MCLVFQDTWYEFRVLAVMQDLISEPSNVAGVSSTGERGLAPLLSSSPVALELRAELRAVLGTVLSPGCP